ncbi:MAG: tRNA/rRNA methyltransferase [Bacteroidota bacterium]
MLEITFILCNSAREENIGAAARALKTMGISCLRLVAPSCDHLGQKAKAIAHGSHDVLEAAKVFPSLESAVEDISFVVGSAAKQRTVSQHYYPVQDIAKILIDKKEIVKKVAVVFGGEESGLSNKQLSLCDILTTIPMIKKYPSLNLGQAVMVYATYLSEITLKREKEKTENPAKDEISIVKEKAQQLLDDVEIDKDGIIYPRIMERLMSMNKDDINLFHSFCKYYLKKYHGRIK